MQKKFTEKELEKMVEKAVILLDESGCDDLTKYYCNDSCPYSKSCAAKGECLLSKDENLEKMKEALYTCSSR